MGIIVFISLCTDLDYFKLGYVLETVPFK